jgi:hypothetical protein
VTARRSTARTRSARLALVSAAAAAAVLLAGCEADQVGAAAVIDGRRVPVETVQTAAQEVQAVATDSDGAAVQRAFLQDMIRSRVLGRAAAAEGISAQRSDVDQFLSALDERAGGRQQLEQAFATELLLPPSALESWARDAVLQEQLGRKLVPGEDADEATVQRRQEAVTGKLAEQVRTLDIDVNPRYGAWDPAALLLNNLPSGGLARPGS